MDDTTLSIIVMLGITFLIGVVYFIPSIVAGLRHHRNFGAIFLVNALVGFTLVGWLVALLMAFAENKP